MIVVLGATGHTGRKIAERLLDAGEGVRVIGRDERRLQPLVERGAEAKVGDAGDPKFLAHAFLGAEAVYALIPPAPTAPEVGAAQDRFGEAAARALARGEVPRVVFLSSLGAELPAGTGPIAGLHRQEERLRALGIDVLLLRATYFFENLHGMPPAIRRQGVTAGALAPDLPVPMVASRDVAEVAARALRERDFRGVKVRELLGARDYTMAEVTRVLGERLGKPDLEYMQLSYPAFAEMLAGAGLSPSMARAIAEMHQAFNDGKIHPLAGRTAGNTTPTRFEDFVGELAGAYRGA